MEERALGQKKSNVESNTQLESLRTKEIVSSILSKLMEQSIKFRKHVAEKRWSNHVKRLDVTMSNPDATRALLIDF